MAHPTFEATTPSLRRVRDKYLDLLLTGATTAAPTAAITPAPATTWTPGQHFTPHAPSRWPPQPAPPPPPPTWASPVTPPAPTEGDVRLAEIAAGLVAAGGVEHRQTETIRRLATQLERSERKLRSLETKKRRARTTLHDDFDETPLARNSAKHDTRRHIRFTPGKESREGVRRTPASTPRKIGRDDFEELHRLRKEREEWLIAKRRTEEESRSLSRMLVDIKKNTSRLVSEREDHLKVISRLQEEVSDLKRRESRWQSLEAATAQAPIPRRSASPVPMFSRRSSSENCVPPNLYEAIHDNSPASVRDQVFEMVPNDAPIRSPPAAPDPVRRADEHGDIASPWPTEREHELREELLLVLEENAKLSGKIPELEAKCSDLAARLHQAETEMSIANSQKIVPSTPSKDIADEFVLLIEELEVLEGVSEAINFGMSPSEVDELQETMSSLDLTVGNVQAQIESGEEPAASTPAEIIRGVVARLVQIRARLSFRYGKWLKAVGSEDITSLGIASHHDVYGENTRTKSMDDTMDTQAIDRIIGLE